MDWPTVSVATDIAAPVQTVWQLASDISLMPQFSDELQSVEWIDAATPRLGAWFKGVNTHPLIGTWTTQSCVIEFDRPRVFAWAVGDPEAPAATWHFEVTDRGEGTGLRYTARIGPGRSGVSMLVEREPQRRDLIVADRLRVFEYGMATTLAGIKALAEAAGQSDVADDLPRRH